MFEGIKSLGFTDFFRMQINNIQISKAMIATLGLNEDNKKQALTEIDKLDKESPEVIIGRILALDSTLEREKVTRLINLFAYQGPIDGFEVSTEWGEEAAKGYSELNQVLKGLEESGVDSSKLDFSPGLVRGLDYYTGLVFETRLNGEAKKIGSIASGGRYDKLVEGGNRDLPGVGASLGLTRLFAIFCITVNPELLKRRSQADVVVIYFSDEQRKTALALSKKFRDGGLNVDLYTEGSGKKLGDKTRYVERKEIPFAAIVFKDDEIQLKTMATRKKETYCSVDEAAAEFTKERVTREEAALPEPEQELVGV